MDVIVAILRLLNIGRPQESRTSSLPIVFCANLDAGPQEASASEVLVLILLLGAAFASGYWFAQRRLQQRRGPPLRARQLQYIVDG